MTAGADAAIGARPESDVMSDLPNGVALASLLDPAATIAADVIGFALSRIQ